MFLREVCVVCVVYLRCEFCVVRVCFHQYVYVFILCHRLLRLLSHSLPPVCVVHVCSDLCVVCVCCHQYMYVVIMCQCLKSNDMQCVVHICSDLCGVSVCCH